MPKKMKGIIFFDKIPFCQYLYDTGRNSNKAYVRCNVTVIGEGYRGDSYSLLPQSIL